MKQYIATLTGPIIYGYVMFTQQNMDEKTKITVKLSGFEPNQTHAMHVHEYGDFRNGCHSCGGHFNPFGKDHGSVYNTLKRTGRSKNDRHVGDLINNIQSDENGDVVIEFFDNLINLYDKNTDILGKSIVIHDGVDDLGLGGNKDSLITGNAGGRMVFAIIGIANPSI